MTKTAQRKTRGGKGRFARAAIAACVVFASALLLATGAASAVEEAPARNADAHDAEVSRPVDAGQAFQVAVHQRIDAPAWASGVRQTWDYVFEAHEAGDPLPEGAQSGRFVWSMTGDARAVLSAKAPAERGTHVYRMYQAAPGTLPEGYTLDPRVYEIRVSVADDGRVYAVNCIQEDGMKTADPGWTVVVDPARPEGGDGDSHGRGPHDSGDAAQSGDGWASKVFGALPKTGDVSLLIAAAAAICACVGSVVLVVARRARRRHESVQEDMR